MDITTSYLGFKLKSPIVPSAGPLSEDVSKIKEMEDAGAGAAVIYSLFEEQLEHDELELDHHTSLLQKALQKLLLTFRNRSNINWDLKNI